MTSTTAPVDYRALSAEWHRTDRTGSTDKVTKAAVVFHENLCEGNYTEEDLRGFWRAYRDGLFAATDDFRRGQFAGMMCAIEDAVKAFEVTKQRRATIDSPTTAHLLNGTTTARREVNVPRRRTDRDAQPVPAKPQGAGSSRERFGNVEAGRYAVEIDGVLQFFKVEIGTGPRWGGFRFVVAESGGNHRKLNRDAQFRALSAIAADPNAALVRYGHETKRCGACHTKLTRPESKKAGVGPDCAAARGIPFKYESRNNGVGTKRR